MKRIRALLPALLLAGAPAFGGTFTADFATLDTSQFQWNGSGTLADANAWFPFIATNRCILTVNQNSLSGSFSPNDFDGGAPIQAFTAKFKLQFGPGTSPPADGAAFSFGPDVNQLSTTYNEVGAGGASFSVSFHTYTSNGGPAVDVYVFGTRIATKPMAVGSMVNSQLQDVVIQLNANSTLNVTYAGQVVYTNLFLPGWGPTNGFFIISARTGGSNEETDIANVNLVTTLATAPVAPTVSTAPQNATVNEGGSASFSVGVDGTGPFTFQWTKSGANIANATNQTLVLPLVLYGDNNAIIAVKITNPVSTITSSPATLTVIRDTTVPTVTKAAADMSFTAIFVTYSKPVSDTALATSNYSLDQGLTIPAITRLNTQTVKLTTSQMAQSKTYNLTINGVQDIDTIPNTIAANTKIQILSFVYLGGTVLHKKYDSIDDNTGWPVSNLFNDSRYPDAPDRVDLEPAFEYPTGGTGRVAADTARDYFDSVEGFFIPPATTNYVFYTAGADRYALWLSTDDNPANKNMITELNGWTNPRGWTQGQPINNGVPTPIPGAQSDQFTGTQWPYPSISLTAGQRYYMLLVHHDPSWAGGDEYAATYKFEGEKDPAPGDAPKLTGSVVGFYFDPTGASINFAQEPKNSIGVQGTTVTLSASATGISVYGSTVSYQWQSAPKGSTTFTDIAGATGATFTTPLLTLANDGTQYRVIATLAPITQTSSVATLTVTADTTPPVVTAGAMPDVVAGTVDIGVGFNKTVDASAGQIANYSVAGGTISSLTVFTNRFTANSQNPLVKLVRQSVLLKVTGLSGNSGVLTVNNITDTYGNKLSSTNLPITVASNMQWGVVGANEFGGTNAVVPVAANGFDIYSDGSGEWGTYDEATFVYEQVTGDFDKKLRIEYQDGSSQWARAGLVVRDVTNFGVNRATQTGSAATAPPYDGKAGRYQKIHVNPVGATLGGPGNPGNQSWEGNRRLDTGSATTSALTGVNSIPQYPNAWCRLQRVGQKFTIYRSEDGVNWVNLGATTWGVDDATKTLMPDTLFVGPEFSPEDGNVTQVADQGTFLAAIRDYGNYVGVFDPQLKIGADSTGKTTVTWSAGTLVSSPTVLGTYTPVAGAASPFVVAPSGGTTMFYRVKQ
jgi:hypothetical protein